MTTAPDKPGLGEIRMRLERLAQRTRCHDGSQPEWSLHKLERRDVDCLEEAARLVAFVEDNQVAIRAAVKASPR